MIFTYVYTISPDLPTPPVENLPDLPTPPVENLPDLPTPPVENDNEPSVEETVININMRSITIKSVRVVDILD